MDIQTSKKQLYLTREQEVELARRWRDHQDIKARDQLIYSHSRLVGSMARKYLKSYSQSTLEDLVQEGHIGLVHAANKFDPELGIRFSTYATHWIRASLQHYALRNFSMVHIMASQKLLFFAVRRLRTQINGMDPERRRERMIKLAATLGTTLEEIQTMDERLDRGDGSLDALSAGGISTVLENLHDPSPLPDEVAELSIDSAKLRKRLVKAMSGLRKREKEILQERTLNPDGPTLQVLSEIYGVSRERIRQIEQTALLKLRESLSRIEEREAA